MGVCNLLDELHSTLIDLAMDYKVKFKLYRGYWEGLKFHFLLNLRLNFSLYFKM